MSSFYSDNPDLHWYLERGIDWERLLKVTEYTLVPERARSEEAPKTVEEAKALYADILDMAGKLAAEEIDPYTHELDSQHPELVDGEARDGARMKQVFARLREQDLHWLCLPRELGGMNAPLMIYFIAAELFARADVSVMTHHSFHGGMAMAMLVYSIREGSTKFAPKTGEILETRFAEEIEEVASGKAWGCMDITEPNAGSDMAALRTKAELDDEGVWRISGEKCFITSGHGKYHFVIARTEGDDKPGLEGLSFFLVPTYREDEEGGVERLATVERVEEKLGHNASVTASIRFDRTPGYLLGERGEGFRYMLLLMNNARLGVGFESLGLCEAAHRKARAYAEERPSMGKTIDRHEMIADYLDEMDVDIIGLRALAVAGAFSEELSHRGRIVLDNLEIDELQKRRLQTEVEHHRARARRLTPLLKLLSSEKAVEMARRCIQIHGGNGYMVEYGAEKLLRDAMVMPIYEGTTQIQALMIMKDTLVGAIRAPQEFIRQVARNRWRSLSSTDADERAVAKLRVAADDVVQFLLRRTAANKLKAVRGQPIGQWSKSFFDEWDPKRDFGYAMLHAERLARLLADVAIAELLLEQASEDAARRPYLRRWLERAEPRVKHLRELIKTTGEPLLARLAEREDAAAAAE